MWCLLVARRLGAAGLDGLALRRHDLERDDHPQCSPRAVPLTVRLGTAGVRRPRRRRLGTRSPGATPYAIDVPISRPPVVGPVDRRVDETTRAVFGAVRKATAGRDRTPSSHGRHFSSGRDFMFVPRSTGAVRRTIGDELEATRSVPPAPWPDRVGRLAGLDLRDMRRLRAESRWLAERQLVAISSSALYGPRREGASANARLDLDDAHASAHAPARGPMRTPTGLRAVAGRDSRRDALMGPTRDGLTYDDRSADHTEAAAGRTRRARRLCRMIGSRGSRTLPAESGGEEAGGARGVRNRARRVIHAGPLDVKARGLGPSAQ